MPNARLLNASLFASLLALLGTTMLWSAAAAADRPNILFIAVDDLRPELGCYGQAEVKSPRIDALARRSVTFTNAFCQQAVCNPSRASMLTGLRPDTIRVWDLRTDFRANRPDAATIPQHFKRHGYHSVGIGKIFHNNIPDPPSWDEELYVDGFPFDPDAVYVNADNLEWLERRKAEITAAGQADRYIDRFGLWYLKAAATEIADVPDSAYYDGAQTDAAIAKLAELKEKGKPFFFGVGYYRPHLPFNVPRRYWDLYDRDAIPLAANPKLPVGAPLMATNTMRELRNSYNDYRDAPRPDQGSLTEQQSRLLKHGYYACVSYIDAQIGRLVDQLDALGLRDNTIVVLWSDHGWKLGEHNSWCKMTNYDIDTRVPLMITVPGARAGGRTCDRLVELVDVFPTLCELAGIPAPEGLAGTSVVPLLAEPEQKWKTAAYSQFLREGPWVAPDGVEYMGYSIRTERYRYVEWIHWGTKEPAARELYDHDRHPLETENVADRPEYRDAEAELQRALRQVFRL